MSETISLGQIKAEIRADIQDFMRKMVAVEKKLGDVGKGARSTEKQAASLGQGFGGLATSVAGAVAAFFSVGAAMKAFDMGRIGAQLKDASIVFKAAGNDIEEFRAKTRNLISDQVLVQKFNFASQMGISKDTFLQLANIADAAAKKMGISQEYAFSSLITGTARGSKLILDNVGILYSAEKAYEDYARSIGKTAKELTDFDQKMATQAAVLKAGNQMIKDVQGVGATVSDVYDQWDATMGNLTTTIGQFFDTIAQKYGIISDLIKAGRDATDVFNQLAKSIKEGGFGKATEDAWGHETGQTIKNAGLAVVSAFGNRAIDVGAKALAGGAQDDALWRQQEKAVELTERAAKLTAMIADAKAGIAERGFADSRDQNNVANLNRLLAKTNEELREARALLSKPLQVGPTEDELKKKFGSYGKNGEWKEGTWRPGLGDSGDLAIPKPSTAQIEGWEQERLRIQEAKKKTGNAEAKRAAEAYASALESQQDRFIDVLREAAEEAFEKPIDMRVQVTAEEFERILGAGEIGPGYEHGTGLSFPDKEEGVKQVSREDWLKAPEAEWEQSKFDSASLINGFGSALMGGADVLGAAIGLSAAGPILTGMEAVLGPFVDVATQVLALDSRLGDAASGAGTAMAAVVGVTLAFFVPVTLALTALTGGLFLLAVPVLLLGAAFAGLTFSLAQNTDSFQRYQKAQSYVVDRLVEAAEPFYNGMLWFVAILEQVANGLTPIVATFAQSEGLMGMMFESVKWTALGFLSLVLVTATLYDAFVYASAGIRWVGDFLVGWVSSGFNGDAAAEYANDRASEMINDFAINLQAVADAMGDLVGMSRVAGDARGEEIAAMAEEEAARKKLNDELYNAPIGFKVAAFRFGAADAATPGVGTGIPGNATPVGGNGGRVIQITGDVNFIIENASEPEDVAGAVADRLEMDERFQTGSSRRIRHPWE